MSASRNKARNRRLKDAAQRYAEFRRQPAQITDAEMLELEKTGEQAGIRRRIMLASLRLSASELIENVSDDEGAETTAYMLELVQSFEQHLTGALEFTRTAAIRLTMALASRPDMQRFLDSAKRKVAQEAKT